MDCKNVFRHSGTSAEQAAIQCLVAVLANQEQVKHLYSVLTTTIKERVQFLSIADTIIARFTPQMKVNAQDYSADFL